MGARRKHRVADIATQAGLSRATVDRVLHGREGVRPETVAQVNQAIDELERQREQVHLSGRTIILDLVMQTPERFAVASRAALEAELRSLRPAVLRARSHLNEHSDPAAAAALLDAVGRKGSHGVILKAPDHPLVVDAVQRLADAGHPDRDVRDRRAGQSTGGVRRHGQRCGGGDGRLPDHAVGRAFRGRPGDGQPHVVPRGGGARGRLPADAGRARARPQGARGEGHRRPGPDDPRGGPRRAWRCTRRSTRSTPRAAGTPPRSQAFDGGRASRRRCTWRTTSTATTASCSARAGSPPSCITI